MTPVVAGPVPLGAAGLLGGRLLLSADDTAPPEPPLMKEFLGRLNGCDRMVCFGSTPGKATAGWSASTPSMNRFHTGAEYVAPKTRRPPTLVMGTLALGTPIQTAVASWGVKPTNHALV